MKTLLITAAVLALSGVAASAHSGGVDGVAKAKAQKPAFGIMQEARRGRGADDGPGHIRQGRGTDDAPGDDRGRRRGGRG